MLPLALYIVAIGILMGTLTDIKKREVPDWVNFGMLAAGLGLSVLAGLASWTWIPIVYSVAGLGAGYLVGAAMYYTGQWGGGDAKMMMGVGALLGLPVTAAGYAQAPLLLVFLLFTVLAGAAYGMAWMLGLLLVHRKKVFAVVKKRLHTKTMLRVRMIVLVTGFLLIALSLFLSLPFRILALALIAIAYLTFYLFFLVKAIEQTCFVKEISVDKLVEGDWVVGEVKKGRTVIVAQNNTGLTKEHIVALKKAKVKTVTVKEGIPFVPSFLIAYVVAVWFWLGGYSLLFWL